MKRLALLLIWLAAPALAQDIELELVLLADTSGSIDRHEVEYQRAGYAEAISDPRVVAVIQNSAYGAIAVTYVEWGDAQKVIAPWTRIASQADADHFAETLIGPPRAVGGKNAIGAALLLGKWLIEQNDFDGLRKVIDISSDDATSHGLPGIEEARDKVVASGIIINGLPVPILCKYCLGRASGREEMLEEYKNLIIGGPGAFVMMVEERAEFVPALRRKLILEISGRMPEDGESTDDFALYRGADRRRDSISQ